MSVDEVTHNVTDAPWYENHEATNQWDRYIREWSGPGDIEHGQQASVSRTSRHPVVFDIETTAEVPQEPILWTVHDSKSGETTVAYDRNRGGRFDTEKIANVVGQQLKARGLYANPIRVLPSVSPGAFERSVIARAAGDPSRVLVGHNVFFDLNIAGRPNDGLLKGKQIGRGWQAATEYDEFTLLSKRAGAYGHIYSLIRHGDSDPETTLNIADTRVAAKSIQISGSLAGACEEFDIPVDKDVDEHGRLTYDYIGYNAGDVASTHALYHDIRRRLHMDFGANLSPEDVYSTASIFKDVLKRMDYDRVHYPKDALRVISPAYFGGRTEAIRCGELIEDVTYTDVLSEYPTVCSLADVWRFMQAERVQISEIDPVTLPTPESYRSLSAQPIWARMADFYVVVRADGHKLPVRTKLPGTNTTRVFNADVHHADGVTTTHHFYDVVSAWLLSGEWPDIVTAFRVDPIGQQDLRDANIGGRRINAYDDILRRAIEERKIIEREYGEGPRENSLKITANSGYGVAAERLVAGDVGHLGVKKHDVAGSFYNPHVAATITAGGRLMLAYGERVADEHGGRLWYCDTDSLVIDDAVVAPVQSAFDSLNPYSGPAGDKDVLEVESEDDVTLRGVDLFAVGEKKYAILKDGELVKFTEHGLGHYEQFRDTDTIARFWRNLLSESHVDVKGEHLTLDEWDEPVIFQQPASTAGVREALSGLVGQEVRYGDWLQQTVSRVPASNTRYVGTDISDRAIKIQGDDVLGAQEIDPDGVKTVRDVLNQWKQSALFTRANPEVRIIGKRTVTKESATVEMDIAAQIEAALNAVDLDILIGEG